MSVEGLCVFLSLFRFLVARSKECLEVFHIQVAESLFYNRVDEGAVVFLSQHVSTLPALASIPKKRSSPWKSKVFDNTMGYPGEDVNAQPSLPRDNQKA